MKNMAIAVAAGVSALYSICAAQNATTNGPNSVAIGVNSGPVIVNGNPVSPEERAKRIVGFLTAKHLPIPGREYSEQELRGKFGAQRQQGFNFGFDILSGSYQGFSSSTQGPIGIYSRLFAMNGSTLVAVVSTQVCQGPGASQACELNYSDWSGALSNIEGDQLQQGQLNVGGSAPGSPFKPGILRKTYAYDGEWKFYIDRMDTDNGPGSITLIVVRE